MSPRNASLIGGNRYYSFDGQRYPSVTTVLQAFPKAWLGRWAAKLVAESAVSELACDDTHCLHAGTHICSTAQHFPLVRRIWADGAEDAVKHLKALPWAKRDAQGARGTAVHQAAERDSDIEDVPENAKKAYGQYVRWLEAYQPVILAKEFQVVNDVLGYAGSGDLIAIVNGIVYLIDIKTSSVLSHDMRLQLAAYRAALFCIDGERVDDAATASLARVERTALLHLTDTDFSFVDVEAGGHELGTFLSVKRVYEFTQGDKQPVGQIVLPVIAQEEAA